MTIQFIGFLAHQEVSESVTPTGPIVNTAFLGSHAKSQEYAGYNKALIAYNSAAPDGFQIAAYAAQQTEKLGMLIAHRPGVMSPTVAAKQFATLDHLSNGRAPINVIAGGNDIEQQKEGDFLTHDQRYERSDEYLSVIKSVWQNDKPFDFDGRYYQIRGHKTNIKPIQKIISKPQIPIYFSGSSPAAITVAGKHADVFMMWGEPLEGIKEQIKAVKAEAQKHGREQHLQFSLSIRPILGATEAEAWSRAERIHASVALKLKNIAHVSAPPITPSPQSIGSQRLSKFASQGDVLDKRLWTGISQLTGAAAGTAATTGVGGNSTALVGTAEQIADSLLDYHDIGITNFLIRGFDPLLDAAQYGKELIPEVYRQAKVRGNKNH
jgi:alkanesulfonate monooxygenase